MLKALKNITFWMAIGIPAVIVGFLLFTYIGLPNVIDLQTKNPKTTALMLQRFKESQQSQKKIVLQQQWVEFAKIPKLLKDTIRITEDAAFYQHKGVDFAELKDAIEKSWKKRKVVRGASTITQQLAKNLYLSTDRSIIRKIKEFLIARRLEANLSKNRIFHIYLNVIEFGPGIFGVQAASRSYFQKDVGQLDLEEIVRLTAIIPKPLKENPTKNSRWLKWKAKWILNTLLRYKYIRQMEYKAVEEKFN
ncbi:MAG: monofunctional biosynthetic peptidoglycan transglycosylase [Desulfobacterales bacterium]|jgi:monofunctional biosynthetic peptidoglycan transglycosylase